MLITNVTEQELIEFVKSMGDAPLNMRNSMTLDLVEDNDCGCLFYEYTRRKYPQSQIECGTGSATVTNGRSIGRPYGTIVRIVFPIFWKDWCPVNEQTGYKDHMIVQKFSDLVLPA